MAKTIEIKVEQLDAAGTVFRTAKLYKRPAEVFAARRRIESAYLMSRTRITVDGVRQDWGA
jgi:hypothetical protein